MRKIFMIFMLALLLLCAMAIPASAEESPIEIHTAEDLQAMAQNPAGSYILMKDLDMAGIPWKSLDFTGKFDGNGYAILNLFLSQPSEETPDSCDGNRKLYETQYVGLFGTLKNAEVKNLKLINVRGLVETDFPCFLAAIAGYCEESTISGCTVTGNLELRAHDRMFGIGGIAGYGSGTIENCVTDVTLICTDTDATTRDEQFLGGAYATGYMDVIDCDITLDGYISEHGYVHSGGLVGMWMQYPLGMKTCRKIVDNVVHGKITFFEDNTDRRAYCAAHVGEMLVSVYEMHHNLQYFKRDERKDYSVELRPEMCPDPVYTETVMEPGCDTFGYTSYRCQTCDYSYTDNYRLFAHSVTDWTELEAPTIEKTGLQEGNCDLCGAVEQQILETLPPQPTQTLPPETEPAVEVTIPEEPVAEEKGFPVFLIVAVVAIVAGVVGILFEKKKKPGKYTRK